jgi:tetratricopeptide (TPR) repeat protein
VVRAPAWARAGSGAASLSCPDESTLQAFIEGRLSEAVLASVDAHLGACIDCRDVVAAVAPVVLAEGGRLVMRGEVAPLPAAPASVAVGPLARGANVGRYVILGLVGRGGMGDVYAAYDPELDRRIALKILHGGGVADQERARSQSRLLKEARAIARLSHPSIVVVHDTGTIDDRVFIAMEFVEGQTLAAWIGGAPRPWAELRSAFLAAGHGLAAAHAARIVHRDFKPQNVMVTPDGSVRVMDFGLASDALGDGDAPAPTGAVGLPDVSRAPLLGLTRTGALLGTPAYMAPEQFLGERADERSDQFAFCVSLYEALHGERPFEGDTVPALAASVTAGKVREPNPRARPPTWLRKIVLRGLRAKREERFPTLVALLAALEHDPPRRRQRVLVGLGLTALLLAGGALTHRTLEHTGASLCHGAGEKLAETWELPAADAGGLRPRHDAIRAAFLATGDPRAAETWKRTAGVLDGYARKWAAMYGEACEATHVRGEQSSEVLDLRMTCLESSRQSLRALGDIFANADVTVVGEAVNAANALPDLSRCADVPVLRAVMPPPSEPEARRKVEALRAAVAEVRALRDAGRWREGLRRLEPLVKEAQALGYKPVVAEALSLLGWIHYWNAEPKSSETAYEEALWAAEASRHDQVSAEAAIQLIGITGWDLSRPDDSQRWAHFAEAVLLKMGSGHAALEGWLAHNRALAWVKAGRLEAAEADIRRAIAAREGALGPNHPDVGTSFNALAECLSRRGKYQESMEASLRARAIYDRAYGPGTAFSALLLSNSAEGLNALGRHAEALTVFRKAQAEAEATLEPNHVWLGYPLVGTGIALLGLARPVEAIPFIERSIAIRDRSEPRLDLKAEPRFALARALWDSGGDRGRARASAEAARAGYAKSPDAEKQLREVDAWLAAHAR